MTFVHRRAERSLLRVVLTGSECAGKTTLGAELARHFGTLCAPEHAREYLESKGAPLSYEDVEPIARGQIEGEDRAGREATRLLILDTDLVSTVLYAQHYYGACPAWIESAAQERLADLYLLLHPDMPWIADGSQRDRGKRREEMHALFRSGLEARGARYVEVRGGWPERRAAAIAAIGRIQDERR